MHHNPNNDPRYRQYQLEMCRDQLNRHEGRFPERRQRGYRDGRRDRGEERPIFNEFGQAINMPPNLRRPPQDSEMFPPEFARHDGLEQQYHGAYQHYPNGPPPPCQYPYNHNFDPNTFSMCYTLSDDPNSPVRRLLNYLQGHPLIPKHMTPRHIVLVYEKPENLIIPQGYVFYANSPPLLPTKAPTAEVAVGDFSVVRYDVETQTEWKEPDIDTDKERIDAPPLSPADNTTTIPCKPIKSDNSKAPAVVELLDDAVTAEFKSSIVKVAEWLQYGKNSSQFPKLPVVCAVNANTNTSPDEGQKTGNGSAKIVRDTHEAKKMKSSGEDGNEDEEGSKTDEKTGLAPLDTANETADEGNEPAAVEATPNTESEGPEGPEEDHEDSAESTVDKP